MSDLCSPEPWFLDALPQLGLGSGGRVLMLTVGASHQVEAILERIGPEGSLTVVEPDVLRTDPLASIHHEGLTVLSYLPDGGESFGTHDVLISSPMRMPDWADSMWADLARGNLRPGGRFLLDLPGERHCSIAAEAWLQLGEDEEHLDCWNGPSERGLARSLSSHGLRNVEGFATSHLMQFDTAHEAAECLAVMLGVGTTSREERDRVDGLRVGLATRCQADGSLELIFQRSRIIGMR